MIFRRKAKKARIADTQAPDKGSPAVVERLEERLLLSSHRYSTRQITSLYSGAVIRTAGGAPSGYSAAQIRHLYGLDKLDNADPSFPLYTNSGDFQTIVVIGAPAQFMNDVPKGREGNINLFHDAAGVKGPKTSIFEVPIPGFDPLTNFDGSGEVETAMSLEWVYAMAPFANIINIQVPTVTSTPGVGSGIPGVVKTSDLQIAIQEAIKEIGIFSDPTIGGPISQGGPGGIVVMPLATVGEDAATTAKFDQLFSYKYAKNISFVAPMSDRGGGVSMPANSPYVTAVGGTVYDVGGIGSDGTRVSEFSSLNSGGGMSKVEPVPDFQKGITVNRRPLTGRAGPDLVLASETRGLGVDVAYDPTKDLSSPVKWYTVEGTSVAASIFGGMVADANELRRSLGQPALGRLLNKTLYAAYKNDPTANFNDITQGNNTRNQAYAGFDLATGMGTPIANTLIPTLAGTLGAVNTNVTFRGNMTDPLGAGLQTSAVTVFQGAGAATVGTQFVSLTLPLKSPVTDQNVIATGTLTVPVLNRGLDNSLSGQGTVLVSGSRLDPVNNTTIPFSFLFPVQIEGRVTGKRSRPRISGTIFTIDSRGRRVHQGNAEIFEGTFG